MRIDPDPLTSMLPPSRTTRLSFHKGVTTGTFRSCSSEAVTASSCFEFLYFAQPLNCQFNIRGWFALVLHKDGAEIARPASIRLAVKKFDGIQVRIALRKTRRAFRSASASSMRMRTFSTRERCRTISP